MPSVSCKQAYRISKCDCANISYKVLRFTKIYYLILLEVKNLGPWAKGLLKGMPQAAAGPAAMAPVAKYPLVLAEDRTRRPDVLRHLKVYEGGWNVTNKHYWAVCVVF
jgi:hypothetical protein